MGNMETIDTLTTKTGNNMTGLMMLGTDVDELMT